MPLLQRPPPVECAAHVPSVASVGCGKATPQPGGTVLLKWGDTGPSSRRPWTDRPVRCCPSAGLRFPQVGRSSLCWCSVLRPRGGDSALEPGAPGVVTDAGRVCRGGHVRWSARCSLADPRYRCWAGADEGWEGVVIAACWATPARPHPPLCGPQAHTGPLGACFL